MNHETDIQSAVNFEIAVEMLAEDGVVLPADQVNTLLDACKGNPCDVPVLYKLLGLVK